MPLNPGRRVRPSAQRYLPHQENTIRRLFATLIAFHSVQEKLVSRHFKLALDLLVLATTYSPISQASLSPVYGSIPASIFHKKVVLVTALLAWLIKIRYENVVERNLDQWITFLPLIAILIPWVQSQLFKQSGALGPLFGPLITETCTYAPLLFISVLAAAGKIDQTQLGRSGLVLSTAVSAGLAITIFVLLQNVMTQGIEDGIGSMLWLSRTGLQYVMAITYALKFPSRRLGYAFLLLIYPLATNFHIPFEAQTKALNHTLHSYDYSLVARQESLTGYISVLDNIKDGFRVMRCDHSLLGGEWINTPRNTISGLKEPIYAVFTMLEAVRLVKSNSGKGVEIADSEKEALVIGLGIGTTPSALIAHGVQTTVVEIDPVVHRYASRYFNLPTNHTAVIKDAISFVEESRENESENRFDYIIHDVFTGGAEPAALFTQEFLSGLKYLLKPDGVIAINYAGNLLLPSTSLVVNTIKSVFPSCRMFREEAAPATPNPIKDFTNMVLFCRPTSGPISFRKPTSADFLGSHARKHHLLPRHEVDPKSFDRAASETTILRQGQTQVLEKSQRQSALDHWKIMRTVLPNVVWEKW